MNEFSDSEIMKRVGEGNLDELSILYERYHLMLFAFFMKHTRQKSMSEDLVQEVFLRIMKYRASFKGEQAFVSWLFGIARNVKFSAIRKAIEKPSANSIAGSSDPAPKSEDNRLSEEPSPSDEVDQNLKTELLYEAIDLMQPENRQLIVLRRIQHLEYPEIADLLNCELSTLRVRTHRAFQELKKHYQELLRRHSNEQSIS